MNVKVYATGGRGSGGIYTEADFKLQLFSYPWKGFSLAFMEEIVEASFSLKRETLMS